MDPEFFDIEAKKLVGLWPRENSLAKIISPYIKRMRGDIIAIEVGVLTGENSYEFLENCENIVKFYGVQDFNPEQQKSRNEYNDILHKNMRQFKDRFEFAEKFPNTVFDLVCVNSDKVSVESLEKYYSSIKPRGIICGNNFHLVNEVRDVIKEFKRKNRIGININIYNEFWFWYKEQS